DGTAPLAQKLREKWLYELARQENWSMYIQHYQPSTDASLQCYAQFAAYQQGDRQRAIVNSKLKWLTGDSLPPACDKLFILLFKENVFNNALIITRVKLALESRNYTLANYLLKKINHPLRHDDQILESIQQHPQRITRLAPNELSSDFYLYGLKRLLTRNATQAIKLWQQAVRQARLTERQQQSFLTQVALYKAMHNQYDAPAWFAKIKQPFNTEAVIDWHIRFALRHRDWATVESLIKHATNHDSPCWQYWLARAMEAQGRHEQATIIYNNLAPNRHYYGFLASIRQHKPLQFDHETVTPGDQALQLYQPITDQIKALYFSKQTARASRLVNDFASELPKDEKSAFAYWIANNLHWFGKSVYLSTHNDLANQLNLRFPLAYHDLIKQQATHYHLSEALIFAMIRQESAFREDVISFAGARGLMQVMPATARWLSTLRHIPFHDKAQLLSIPYNIMLGTAYLNQLGNRFNNHPLLMAAAYNAGPRQVQAWLNSHPLQQADIWIETIPFYETRNYLKNVIAFYAVYQHRLQQKPNLDAFLRPFI
ncbi:MAG: lytic murein transglycosylase, partial [Legionellales bacterium RIFCSPHIGHO2_12_FULL_42_9]